MWKHYRYTGMNRKHEQFQICVAAQPSFSLKLSEVENDILYSYMKGSFYT